MKTEWMDLPQPDESASEAAGRVKAIRRGDGQRDGESPAPAPGLPAQEEPMADAPPPDDSVPHLSKPDANMLAHISMRGDVLGRAGAWLGERGSRLAIEAIMVAPAGAGPPPLWPSVETQLIYPHGLRTPWTPAGEACGSVGFGLGCLGVRFRLSPETSAFFECRYDIAFTDGTLREDVPGAVIARAPSGAAVEAIRLRISQREPVPLVVLNDLPDDPAPGEWETEGADPAVRLRLLSPAFATRMPDILNAASIPKDAWQAMAVSFDRRVFGARTITVRLIEDAIVAGEGVVFDGDLTVVRGTSRLMGDPVVERYRQMARDSRGAQTRRLAGMSVLCKTVNPNNYGHFLIEMYPKAWLAARLLSGRPAGYIIHQTDNLQIAQDALTRIGINPYAISVTNDEPVHCEQLIVIDGLTSHGVYQSPVCAQALTELAEPVPAGHHPKIFVSRHAQGRVLHNQEAAEAVLRKSGFAIVDPGRLSLAEQIALFKGANTVVGPLGAALTNIAFCPRGSTIVALTAQSFPDTFFWFLSQHCGHDYREVRCRDASGRPEEARSWEAGFTLSDEDLAVLAAL
jgi:capsular polysaccharide biosynthesis protein